MSSILRDILRPLHLSPQEEAIFMLLAQRGAMPASSVARLTGVKRTTCYSLLDRMMEMGVLIRSVRKGVRVFDAADPRKIGAVLDARLGVLQDARQKLEDHTEEIASLYASDVPATRVTLYEGYDEITKAYDRILDADGDTIYALTRKRAARGHRLEKYWKSFLERRMAKGKKMCAMVNDYEGSEEYFRKSAALLREAKLLPEHVVPLWGDLQVCGDVVNFVSQNEGRIWGITIQDAHVAAMFQAIHQELWKKGEKRK